MDRPELRDHIRAVPDFPKPGILFRDITPLLANPDAFGSVIDYFVSRYEGRGIDAVVGIESRGFLFGAPLALRLGCAFVPLRKVGKLPAETIKRSYALEYGEATLEIHADALGGDQKVVLFDDLLATGGTAKAGAELVEEAGAKVEEIAFVVALEGLGGQEKLEPWTTHAVVSYGLDDD